MKMNRSGFRIYLDICIFLVASIACGTAMIIGIISNNHIMQPAMFFLYIYLINLVFYRICIEMDIPEYENILLNVFMTILCMICLIITIMLIVYLVYFSLQAFLGKTLLEIIYDHVLYATIVGSLFMIHLANDNMAAFYNLYVKDNK